MLLGVLWSQPAVCAATITLTDPTDGQAVNTSPYLVTGVVDDPNATRVTIAVRVLTLPGRPLILDQRRVAVDPQTLTFSASMTLREGANQIAAKAETDDGTELARMVIQITLDTVAPVTTITWPEEGAVIGPNSIP